LGVVEQAPDQRALAVVDRAGGGEPQQVRRPLGEAAEDRIGALGVVMDLGGRVAVAVLQRARNRMLLASVHQKYPCRLRSSIAASVTRSSARVCPRSVTSVAAISATTCSSVAASDSTAPVQLMSPTVR